LIVRIIVMILIIILIIIGLILLEPVSFKIKAAFGDENKFSFSAHTMLHVISVKYSSTSCDGLAVRILGFIKIPLFNDNEPDSVNDDNEDGESPSALNEEEKKSKEKETDSAARNGRKPSFRKKVKNKSVSGSKKKKKTSIDAVLSKIKNFKDVKFASAISHIIKNVVGIIKSFRIHFKDSRISYSTGYPDLTGYVTGFFSVMPFSYMKGLRIEPDFTGEDIYFNGHIEAHGHIIIIVVIIYLIRILLNYDVRQLINAVKGKE